MAGTQNSKRMKEKILIVEDQFIEANNLQEMLELVGYRVCGIARSVPKAVELLEQHRPDLVIIDIFLKGPLTGIDLAKKLREQGTPFIYLSANSDKQTLEAAKATNPYGFLVKPVREKDILVMIEIARYKHEHNPESASRKIHPGAQRAFINDGVSDRIIGGSQAMQGVMKLVEVAAPVDTSVLIQGENGTGKERIAESIYERSSRRNKPLTKVNCAALPPTLIESILFGHERGAFTGAIEKRIGKFEQAHDGTIFLDEIGEMPLEMQAKFLRVLQEREIERIGSNKPIKVNVRIIAATNRNLEKEIAEGRFRMDLYFRLNVFPIHIPPLRDRKEDLPALVAHFIDVCGKKYNKPVRAISHPLLNDLLAYHWPGNVRELEHLIERSVLLCEGETIKQLPDFQIYKPANTPLPQEGRVKTMEEMERDYILQVLEKCNGKIFGKGGAAELLGMHVSTLNSRIKKLGIEKEKIRFTGREE
jgi:two-component system response regulator HydG